MNFEEREGSRQKAEGKAELFEKVVTYGSHTYYFCMSLRGEAVAISILDNNKARHVTWSVR